MTCGLSPPAAVQKLDPPPRWVLLMNRYVKSGTRLKGEERNKQQKQRHKEMRCVDRKRKVKGLGREQKGEEKRKK